MGLHHEHQEDEHAHEEVHDGQFPVGELRFRRVLRQLPEEGESAEEPCVGPALHQLLAVEP